MPDETSAVTQAEGPGITSTGKSEGLPRQQTVDQAGGAAGDHILVATDKRLGNAQVHQ